MSLETENKELQEKNFALEIILVSMLIEGGFNKVVVDFETCKKSAGRMMGSGSETAIENGEHSFRWKNGESVKVLSILADKEKADG